MNYYILWAEEMQQYLLYFLQYCNYELNFKKPYFLILK